jgi:hypothetical protein
MLAEGNYLHVCGDDAVGVRLAQHHSCLLQGGLRRCPGCMEVLGGQLLQFWHPLPCECPIWVLLERDTSQSV